MFKKITTIKLTFLIASLILIASCASQKNSASHVKTQPNKNLVDIYVLMGQSNMAGRGPMRAGDDEVKNSKLFMLTKDLNWVAAKNPIHFDKPNAAAVGPGMAFGLAMQAANKTHYIYLVPTAVGGTSINLWVPGAYDKVTKTSPWDDAEKRIIEAMKYGTIKGIIWHQGESDSSGDKSVGYLKKLEDLIVRVRKLVANPNLPFVAGELGKYGAQYNTINKQLEQLVGKVKFTAVASSEDLVDKGDGTHFDAASADKLGQRLAEKMQALQKRK